MQFILEVRLLLGVLRYDPATDPNMKMLFTRDPVGKTTTAEHHASVEPSFRLVVILPAAICYGWGQANGQSDQPEMMGRSNCACFWPWLQDVVDHTVTLSVWLMHILHSDEEMW